MSGIQEILVIVVILLGIFFIPRITRQGQNVAAPRTAFLSASRFLSGPMRLAIVTSVVWPLLAAAYYKPWQNEPLSFFYIGAGPVAAAWSVYWIVTGYRKKR